MEETVDVDLQMNVFPNPAKELLHVSVSTGKLPNVKVLDLQGREAFAPITFQTGNSADVNVSHLPNGMYLLQADGVSKRFAVMH